jgi:hypothetical protein
MTCKLKTENEARKNAVLSCFKTWKHEAKYNRSNYEQEMSNDTYATLLTLVILL